MGLVVKDDGWRIPDEGQRAGVLPGRRGQPRPSRLSQARGRDDRNAIEGERFLAACDAEYQAVCQQVLEIAKAAIHEKAILAGAR
jgi:hypothetical protein